MRRAIEKLSFLVISLATASLLSFALLSRLADRGLPAQPALPLLVNTHPHDVRDLAAVAVQETASDGPNTSSGRKELARLGGAALPYVLPRFEALAPEARGRVALALAPIARRMGLGSDADFASPARAVEFFTRFWQDRGADFRAAAVRRKVQRLAERALPLRQKEVIELDTFALPELFDALGRVRTHEDAERVERLHPILEHVTGQHVALAKGASVERAAVAATAWRDWAFEHAAEFTTLDGPARLAATVLETRYFHFLATAFRAARNDDPKAGAALRITLTRARSSVAIALVALALAVGAATLLMRFLRTDGRFRRPAQAAGVAVSLAPLAVWAVWGARLGSVGTTAALALALTALLLLDLRGRRDRRRLLRWAIARAGTLLPLTLAAELAAGAGLGTGLGDLAARTVGRNDLEGMMWVAMALSVPSGLALLLPSGRARGDRNAPVPADLVRAPLRKRVLWGCGCVLVALAAGALVHAPAATAHAALARAAATLLLALALTAGTAFVVGVPLGILAGGVSRAADLVLSRALEITQALPIALLAGAVFTFGPLAGASMLGVLRGLEVGHVLRRELTERRIAEDLDPPSLGRMPLSPYLRRVLPAALAPAGLTLALTAPWLATLLGTGARLGALPATSLPALAVGAGGLGFVAVALLMLLAGVLVTLVYETLPRTSSEDPVSHAMVLPLRRRIDSTRPPSTAPGPGPGPSVP